MPVNHDDARHTHHLSRTTQIPARSPSHNLDAVSKIPDIKISKKRHLCSETHNISACLIGQIKLN